ncbi:hypothetical protein HAX54_039070 [Datura stramonium]|uniref:Uncharacterized protein n=1 Tax=Datura stramonium TaxID=4076 RepID=A0ABS8VKN2_DATST|nr:hypothetical protein [Datura stramonium]
MVSQVEDQEQTNSGEEHQLPQIGEAKKLNLALLPSTSTRVASAATPSQASHSSRSDRGNPSSFRSLERPTARARGKHISSSPAESSSKDSSSREDNTSGIDSQSTHRVPPIN